jgi:hypothetical protein
MTTHDSNFAADAKSLANRVDFSRRTMLVTTLATGFAASVQPVMAQTITTDAAGLEAGEVKIKTADGDIPAYRAMPASGTGFPVVLVVACTSTSRTSAAVSPRWAISLLRRKCMRGRAMSPP